MHVVRWESRILLGFVDGLLVEVLCHHNLLYYSRYYVLVGDALVGLHTGQAERREPLDGVAAAGNNLRALSEPLFDVVGVPEQVTNTLDRDTRQIL